MIVLKMMVIRGYIDRNDGDDDDDDNSDKGLY